MKCISKLVFDIQTITNDIEHGDDDNNNGDDDSDDKDNDFDKFIMFSSCWVAKQFLEFIANRTEIT